MHILTEMVIIDGSVSAIKQSWIITLVAYVLSVREQNKK